MTSELQADVNSIKYFPKITWTAWTVLDELYVCGWTRAPDGTVHQLAAAVGPLRRTATQSTIRSLFAADIGRFH